MGKTIAAILVLGLGMLAADAAVERMSGLMGSNVARLDRVGAER